MPESHSSKEQLDVGEFTLHLRNVSLPLGLKVDDVRLAGNGLHLERDPFVITVAEPGTLEVFVSEASLASFLDTQAPAGLKNFKVQARDGKLFVHAVKTVIVDLKASAVCSLVIEDWRKLIVVLESVDVAGAGIKNLIQAQLDKINPIFDLSDLPVNGALETISMEKGGVVLFGSVSP